MSEAAAFTETPAHFYQTARLLDIPQDSNVQGRRHIDLTSTDV